MERQIQHSDIFGKHTINLGVPEAKPQKVEIDESWMKQAMEAQFKEGKK